MQMLVRAWRPLMIGELTLQVFGVKATCMNQFKDWIFCEVPEAQGREVWDLPAVKTLPKRRRNAPPRPLRLPRLSLFISHHSSLIPHL